jgi:hypothetical protein
MNCDLDDPKNNIGVHPGTPGAAPKSGLVYDPANPNLCK